MSVTAELLMFSSSSPQLTAELWISFASLVRSHAAMHSIAAPGSPLRIHSHSNSRLEVLGPIGKLSIVGPNASGIGTTEFRPEAGESGDEYAAFSFTEDGLVLFEGADSAIEIEAAVEHLLQKVQA
ncbi:MAG: hypothetical protein ABI076_06165 [Acidobacteriaceae bacterium]